MTIERIAMIGAGSIGGPIAERLIETGHRLMICDPSEQVRAHFKRLGCEVTSRAQDCATAPAIIAMVANDQQLMDALSGPAGLLSGLDPNTPVSLVIMSTVLPDTIKAVAGLCAGHNVSLIDAPVSGGSVKARRGELSIMVGGGEADIARVRPILASVASNVFHCGELGSGETTKILNNLVGVTNLFLFAETMRIAQALGMDLQRLTKIMEQSSGRNAGTRNWVDRKALFAWNSKDEQTAQSVVRVTQKDLRNALALQEETGVRTSLLRAIVEAHQHTSFEHVLETWGALASDQNAK